MTLCGRTMQLLARRSWQSGGDFGEPRGFAYKHQQQPATTAVVTPPKDEGHTLQVLDLCFGAATLTKSCISHHVQALGVVWRWKQHQPVTQRITADLSTVEGAPTITHLIRVCPEVQLVWIPVWNSVNGKRGRAGLGPLRSVAKPWKQDTNGMSEAHARGLETVSQLYQNAVNIVKVYHGDGFAFVHPEPLQLAALVYP